MLYMISYDIQSNRLRKKVFNLLIYFGLDRVQFSVFIGKLSTVMKRKLILRLEILELKDGTDSILIVPLRRGGIELCNNKYAIIMKEVKVEVI